MNTGENMEKNLTLTYPQDGSCAILGEGFPLDTVAASNTWGMPLTQIPILTNVMRISTNRFFIPSKNTSILLNYEQFLSVAKKMGLVVKIKDDGPPQLTIFKERSTGDLILENFDITKQNACFMSHLALNLWHSLENTLQILQHHWDKLQTILKFYGNESLLQHLATCLNSRNVSLDIFLNAPTSSFHFCVDTMVQAGNDTIERERRTANILSFLLGDGKQLNNIETSLQESIKHYNENFRQLKIFDDKIIDNFQSLENDITQLAKIEINLQDQMTELTRFSRITNIKFEYLLTKMQHSSTLHRLLTESKILDNLALLERALFSSNECTLAICESAISAEGLGTKILVHRELIELKPIKRYIVSCQAPSITLVPTIHNSMAEKTESGNFLINTRLYSQDNLGNATFVNTNLRPLPASEKLLETFHHFSITGKSIIQCLRSVTFSLNSNMIRCTELQTFGLPEKF